MPGSSRRRKRAPWARSPLRMAPRLSLGLAGCSPRRRKHSSAAVRKKQTAVPRKMGDRPTAVYSRLPRKGVTSEAREETWLTRALPRSSWDSSTIWGTQAWTVGDSKAPKTERITSSAPVRKTLLPRGKRAMAPSTASPERASRATMMFRRLARSASTPPKGESKMVGTMETAKIPAKVAAEPVSSSTNMERANRRV